MCMNHSRHMAGSAAAALQVHTRAPWERGLSPCLEAGQPAAECPAVNHIGRERPENVVEWRKVCTARVVDCTLMVPRCRLGCLPPNSRSVVESVSDVPRSLRISGLSLKPTGLLSSRGFS